MVKFFNATATHDYPFPTVTLAYFLRYPNPYSTHVLSTDTISRHFDPEAQRLHTTRLHVKRSRLPPALLAILPASVTNSKDGRSTQSYILEQTVVDVRTGVMCTESRNLEFTGVLTAREMQIFSSPGADVAAFLESYRAPRGFPLALPSARHLARPWSAAPLDADAATHVSTMVELKSRLGEVAKERFRKRGASGVEDDAAAKPGFFQSWTTGSLQRTIESFGLSRTERAVPKAKQGLNVVLERLRKGGLVAVLEGMKKDREMAMLD